VFIRIIIELFLFWEWKKVTYIMLNKNILKLLITNILEVVVRYGFDDWTYDNKSI